jgi:pyridoxamine 5'-phosphate oxidase
MEPADIRKEYKIGDLRRADLLSEPIAQFQKWFDQAVAARVLEPNAMTLATVDTEGQPSSRIVLLKDIDTRGFSFFTNYESRKGLELAANPRAALTLFWPALERQVCIRGSVTRLSREESEAYFISRPLGSRLGAWVSSQSTPIPDRAYLDKRLSEVTEQYKDKPPIPPYWGGYVLSPVTVEFWQGRPNRLHDRFRYTRENTNWKIDRLSP